MRDLEGRQTTEALAEVTRDPRWTDDDKKRLAAVVTLAMIAGGRSADVSPDAMRVTHEFLSRNGVDLTADATEIQRSLTKALATSSPPAALARSAAQIVTQDASRRQAARQRRAAAQLNPPNRNQAVQTTNGQAKAVSLLSLIHGAHRS